MSTQWTLGQLIDALELAGRDLLVEYDFGYFVPTGFASWRGSYERLALGYAHWSQTSKRPTVGSLLQLAKAADGTAFEGWHGGEYRMSRDTLIYVANEGEACECGVVGGTVNEDDGVFVLQTGRCGL